MNLATISAADEEQIVQHLRDSRASIDRELSKTIVGQAIDKQQRHIVNLGWSIYPNQLPTNLNVTA